MVAAQLASDTDSALGLLLAILSDARERGATHIHLEPRDGGGLAVRMRIAGALTDAAELSAGEARDVLARLDGNGLEVARLAEVAGERAVIHLPPRDPEAGDLAGLGMPIGLVRAVHALQQRPGGLVLVAGPPGAGITTTLRVLTRRFDDGTRNLLALGAGEGAERLRAILRQDPDGVTIDALADRETATLAVQAAESGKLVLAGLDARDAVSAVLRMRELRVEAFPFASALRLLVAQRLVRRLCGACRRPVQAQGSVSALLGFDPGAIVHAPFGCDACGGSGFAGETGVFEAVVVDSALRRLVAEGGDVALLARHAYLNAPSLGSSARALVREGVTTPEEAVRVSRG